MSNKINNRKLSNLYDFYIDDLDRDSLEITRRGAKDRKLKKKATSKARRRFDDEE